MSKQIINCAKCQKELNYLPYHSYAEPPAMKSKEGKFYCFDCFKSVSSCKICNKSVAQMDINIHDKKTWYQPWEKIYFREAEHIKLFDMCGSYCDFFCSPECLSQDPNRNHELRKKRNQEKLAKGWKHCEECVEMFEGWYAKIGINKESRKKALLYHGKVLPPGEKICSFHQRSKEKDRYVKEVIYPKAQKWWDNLTYEQKLAEVKRLDICWIIRKDDDEIRRSATHQEVAQEKEIPHFFISQDFEHKEPCITCGKVWKCVSEINCGKNSPNGKISYCASCPSGSPSVDSKGNHAENGTKNSYGSVLTEIEEKRVKLQRLKDQGGNSEEVRKLEQEIEELLKEKIRDDSSSKELSQKNDPAPWIVGGISVIALFGIIMLIVRTRRKKPKIKL